jgi:hypothetical protein
MIGETAMKDDKLDRYLDSDCILVVKDLLEALKQVHYLPCKSCSHIAHADICSEPNHNEICTVCNNYRCEQCAPDCWLSNLIAKVNKWLNTPKLESNELNKCDEQLVYCTPRISEKRKCIACAKIEQWALFDNKTATSICINCMEAIRRYESIKQVVTLPRGMNSGHSKGYQMEDKK